MATKIEIVEFLKRDFPQTRCIVDEVGNASATVRHHVGTAELRPGGTVSGPVLMAVADVALYVALLGEIGIVPLAVTTSLSINFLRKPSPSRGHGCARGGYILNPPQSIGPPGACGYRGDGTGRSPGIAAPGVGQRSGNGTTGRLRCPSRSTARTAKITLSLESLSVVLVTFPTF